MLWDINMVLSVFQDSHFVSLCGGFSLFFFFFFLSQKLDMVQAPMAFLDVIAPFCHLDPSLSFLSFLAKILLYLASLPVAFASLFSGLILKGEIPPFPVTIQMGGGLSLMCFLPPYPQTLNNVTSTSKDW